MSKPAADLHDDCIETRDEASSGMLNVEVWRGSADEGSFRQYKVPQYKSQTVLDIVSWIQQHEDAGLSYRFACRVGMCGSCAMMVNGVPRWTCRTHVERVVKNASLRIAPLRNLPVIRDLVVDMDPFFDKWTKAEGFHHPSRSRHDPVADINPQSQDRMQASAGIECINCAVCYAACDTVAGNDAYLGPAALMRAWTVLNDTRDAGKKEVLDAVSGHGGCHNCHSMGSCAQYCPNELNPMLAIAGLKRETVRAMLPGSSPSDTRSRKDSDA